MWFGVGLFSFLTGKHSCRHLAFSLSLSLLLVPFSSRLCVLDGRTFAQNTNGTWEAKGYEKAGVVYSAISSTRKVVELVNMSLAFTAKSLSLHLFSSLSLLLLLHNKTKGPAAAAAINYSSTRHLFGCSLVIGFDQLVSPGSDHLLAFCVVIGFSHQREKQKSLSRLLSSVIGGVLSLSSCVHVLFSAGSTSVVCLCAVEGSSTHTRNGRTQWVAK
jgi:hypothetical protein